MTVAEIVDAIWANPVRTIDGQAPVASDGSYIDDVGYAVWTYITRTVEGGSGINGTIATNQATQVTDISGSLTASGTIATNQAVQVTDITGSLVASGAIATNQAAQVSDLTGNLVNSGAIATNQAAQESDITAVLSIVGSIATNQAVQVTDITGFVGAPAFGGFILGNVYKSAVGNRIIVDSIAHPVKNVKILIGGSWRNVK